MTHLSYAALETAIVALFIVACLHAWRRGSLLEIVSAAFYGLLLEEGDILIFKTYHYNAGFILRLDRVPVAIALAWAVIVYTCMHLSDAYGLPSRLAPFADAVWAIMLDLAFDAIAIRLGLWTWVIPLNAGFFGVPAGNFYAWLFVAFSFSLCTRIARSKTVKKSDGFEARLTSAQRTSGGRWQPAVPFAAYACLLLSMVPFTILKNAFFPQSGGGLEIFWAVLATFVAVAAWAMAHRQRRPQVPFDWIPVLLRNSFHVYFLASLLITGLFLTVPALLAISVVMLVLDVLLAWQLWNISRADKTASSSMTTGES